MTVPVVTVLGAASTTPGSLFQEILPWVLALLGLTVVGAIVIVIARRMVRNDDASEVPGFSLHSLRQMHAAGQLSDEEFARAKANLIDSMRPTNSEEETGEKSATENLDPSGSPGNEPPDDAENVSR